MADEVTVKDTGGSFTPHEEGQFAAVCVDVINLGARVEQFPGSPARIVDKVAIVFGTDTDKETKDIAGEYTLSMNEKAKLRAKLLEPWRGKTYTEDEARKGIPLHKLVGKACLLSAEHATSAKGRTYAKIVSIGPLPKKIEPPDVSGYKRPEFWAERVAKYKAECEKWADAQLKASGAFEDFPEAIDAPDDDIGF